MTEEDGERDEHDHTDCPLHGEQSTHGGDEASDDMAALEAELGQRESEVHALRERLHAAAEYHEAELAEERQDAALRLAACEEEWRDRVERRNVVIDNLHATISNLRSSRSGGAGRREHIGNAIPPPTAEAITWVQPVEEARADG